jgi:diguanylate cyclase (GGDEF)-like protein
VRLPRHSFVIVSGFLCGLAIGIGSLTISGLSSYATVLWPASGAALAVTLGLGSAAWPGIWGAAAVTLLVASGDPPWALAASIGFAIEPIVAAALIERFGRGVHAYRKPDSIFRAALIVAVAGAPIPATTVSVAALLLGHVSWGAVGYLWLTWWLAAVAGTLVVAPVVLAWAALPFSRVRLWPLLEAVVMLGAICAVAAMVFGGRFPAEVKTYPLEFLCVPFLLWAAFRQGPRTVSIAAAVLCGLAAWGTQHGFGPFVRGSSFESTMLVQVYALVTATMAAVIGAVIADHRVAHVQLQEMAATDPLTGLANYRRLLDVLRFEITRSNRTGRPFAVLFLDMDGLKAINDRRGHMAGSRALCRLADTLRTSCRATDTPARFGGDEFAVVLPETVEDEGYVVLNRITAVLAADDEAPAISVSAGVAVFPRDGSSPTQLLRSADKVLYEAKTRAASRGPQSRRTGTEA